MTKIAICVSGQTRDISSNPEVQKGFADMLSLFDDWDYDLYGHTWSDQTPPGQDILDMFTQYTTTDQECIWNDVIAISPVYNRHINWTNFFSYQREWDTKQEYVDILNGTSDKSYIDFAKDRIKGTVGQVWSAHESFKMVNQGIPYKFIVRLRWDIGYNDNLDDDHLLLEITRFKRILLDWTNKKNGFANGPISNTNCLAADDSFNDESGIPFMNDHVFVFNNNAQFRNNILKVPTVESLCNIIRKYIAPIPSAHDLWAQWFAANNISFSTVLPNITVSKTNPDIPGRYINDYWDV